MITHMAYLIIIAISWTWAVSQLWFAITQGHLWPPPWRLTAGLWLTCKAIFLSYLGWAVWDDMDDLISHRVVIIGFAAIHLVAFIQWAHLPGNKPVPEPPAHPG